MQMKEVIVSQIKPFVKDDMPVRVAFYVRVSTDTDMQMNSFENQRAAVDVVLKQHPEFRLVKIYSDAGITGTLAEKRPGFMEMIEDCEMGLIDLIYTKSLSRWSRNTLECLMYYRSLKEIGVNLIFEKECIDTRNVFTEMALSIYASFSQEESRSISENTKMGIRWRFQMGQDIWKPMYGFAKGYQIIEAEAAVVRKIYSLYEHGASLNEIAEYLNVRGIPTPRGKKWNSTGLSALLNNEKYVGDVEMQKTYIQDHLNHKAVKNDGTVVPTYTVRDHHKGIVSREQFDRVTAIRAMKKVSGGDTCNYPFGDKLVCPYCGERLSQRNVKGGAWGQGRGWECRSCGEFLLKAKCIEEAVLDAYQGLDERSIKLHIPRMREHRKHAAERLICLKKEDISEVHYFWVDQLIDRIEFGEFTCEEDSVIRIRWKFGMTSTRPIKNPKTPKQYAELARKVQEKAQKKRKKLFGTESIRGGLL